tara:strand:+ start:449 stop:646 length:198 start_codon:yes stop_codon:yes gene_type:complete
MTTEEQIKDLENFLKEAFCIDGECKKKGFDQLISKNGEHRETLTFKLNDSKRGVFLVSIASLNGV